MKNSSIPWDIPKKLKKEFVPELAKPLAHIFNTITRTGEYPRQWVTEFVTPIPKVTLPETEDDLRNISLTADLSKNYEQFLADWLTLFKKKRIDPGQFGGLGGPLYLTLLDILLQLYTVQNRVLKITKSSTYCSN